MSLSHGFAGKFSQFADNLLMMSCGNFQEQNQNLLRSQRSDLLIIDHSIFGAFWLFDQSFPNLVFVRDHQTHQGVNLSCSPLSCSSFCSLSFFPFPSLSLDPFHLQGLLSQLSKDSHLLQPPPLVLNRVSEKRS